MVNSGISVEELNSLLDDVIAKITNLISIFCNLDSYTKRKIIGSMFMKKFTFEDLEHRTIKTNYAYELIYLINRKIYRKTQRASHRKTRLPTLAPSAGLEPATL